MPLKLFAAKEYSEKEILCNKDRMPEYKPHHKVVLSKADLDKIHKKLIGEYRGFTFWLVDGNYIREKIDQDGVLGYNGARYRYTPEDELWCEVRDPVDMFAVFTHELVETIEMIKNKKNYDKGHDIANTYEIHMRRETPMHTFKEFTEHMNGVINEDWSVNKPAKATG